MSEPSPGAKQAAEKEIHNVASEGIEGCEPVGYYVQQAIDTATAKAREEYEETLADHRELVRELDVALNGSGAAKQASLCDIVAQVKQLTHEQPSATGHECPFCGALGVLLNLLNNHDFPRRNKVWVQCNGCGARGPKFDYYSGNRKGEELAWEAWKKRNVFVGQPSAPTAGRKWKLYMYPDGSISLPSQTNRGGKIITVIEEVLCSAPADDSWCGCTNQNRDPKCKIHN